MQSGCNTRCQFCSVVGSIQKAVYIAALVAASKQVVELPHGEKQDKMGASGCKIQCCNYLIFS